jgi:hypothetical protein
LIARLAAMGDVAAQGQVAAGYHQIQCGSQGILYGIIVITLDR